MYSAEVLDHFEHPRNAGVVADADAEVQIENPACGDVLKLTLKLAGDRIGEIRFGQRMRQFHGVRFGADRACERQDRCGCACTEARTTSEERGRIACGLNACEPPGYGCPCGCAGQAGWEDLVVSRVRSTPPNSPKNGEWMGHGAVPRQLAGRI
jgi:hypothetical protein